MRLTAYAFRQEGFVSADGDTHVCVVARSALTKLLTVRELRDAFSGAIFYRRGYFGPSYVGVWGRRNGKRLRRFLRERGAEVLIERTRPEGVRLEKWLTKHTRVTVRDLPPKVR